MPANGASKLQTAKKTPAVTQKALPPVIATVTAVTDTGSAPRRGVAYEVTSED